MNKITDYRVEYAALKKAIRKSMDQGKSIDFNINYPLLNGEIKDMGIIAVEIPAKSKKVSTEDVAYLSEYFKGKYQLSWLNKFKHFSNLVFIVEDSIDDRCKELLDDIKKPVTEDPDIDKVEILAEILANYPCYMSTIVSYKSSDPKRVGLLCSQIICKANSVTISKDNARYHKPENEEDDEEVIEEE